MHQLKKTEILHDDNLKFWYVYFITNISKGDICFFLAGVLPVIKNYSCIKVFLISQALVNELINQ